MVVTRLNEWGVPDHSQSAGLLKHQETLWPVRPQMSDSFLREKEVEPGIFLGTWPVPGLAGQGGRPYLANQRPAQEFSLLWEFNFHITTLSSSKRPSPLKLLLCDYILQCILVLPSTSDDSIEKSGCQWFILSH